MMQRKGRYECYACGSTIKVHAPHKLDERYTCPRCTTKDRVRSLLRPA